MSASTPPYEIEYGQVNDNLRALADIRFKLLALIPPLSGVAIFLLTQAAVVKKETAAAPPTESDLTLVLLLSLMGFLATFGLTAYDQRNSELYDALMKRARALEKRLNLIGGQIGTRPARGRHFLGLLLMWHDLGLSLIYGSVLGAWFFPAVYSALRLLKLIEPGAYAIPLLTSALAALLFIAELLRQDGAWLDLRARVLRSVSRDEETVKELILLKNLADVREGLKRYAAETCSRPRDLCELLSEVHLKHLKHIPRDPFTARPDAADNGKTWDCEREKAPRRLNGLNPIVKVHSSSTARSSENLRWYTDKAGKLYNEW